MSKNCYTFIFEYNGGTFISQIYGSDIEDAKMKWAQQLDFKMIGASESNRKTFLNDVFQENPVPLTNVKFVWCLSPNIGDRMGIVHIILTGK